MSILFECCSSFLADAVLRQNVVRRNQVKAMQPGSQKKAYVQRQLHTAKFNTEEKLDNDISMSSDGQEQKVSHMDQANRKQSCCFTRGTS